MFANLLRIQKVQQMVRMKKHTQYLLALLLILASYGHIKGNELDYSTTQIKKMWFECSTGLRVNYPKIPAQIKIVLCDCYINHMREKYSAEEVLEITKEESWKLGLEVAQICKIPEKLRKTTRAITQGAA